MALFTPRTFLTLICTLAAASPAGAAGSRFLGATGSGFTQGFATRISDNHIFNSPGDSPNIVFTSNSSSGGGSTSGGVVDDTARGGQRSILIADLTLAITGTATDLDASTTKFFFSVIGAAHFYHPEAYTGSILTNLFSSDAVGFNVATPAFFTMGSVGDLSTFNRVKNLTSSVIFPSGSSLPVGDYGFCKADGTILTPAASLTATDSQTQASVNGWFTALLVVPAPGTGAALAGVLLTGAIGRSRRRSA